MASPYLTFEPKRVAGSLLAAVVLVVVLAFVAKAVVEGLTDLTYTIHWFETVPFLVVGAAFVLNAMWNERAESAGEP